MSSFTAETANSIKTLILSDLTEEAEQLALALSQFDGMHVRSADMAFGEGLKAVERFRPQVLIVTETLEGPAVAIEALDDTAPDIPALAILPQGDLQAAHDCSLAGARAALLRPFDHETLVELIRQVHLRESRRKQHVAASLEAGEARQQRPRIIAVHGAKGGVGATTIACNLAVSLRVLTHRRVAVVDGDVLSGTTSVFFDMKSARSISDLLPHLKDLEADLVQTMMAEHATGVRVLCAPVQLQRAETIDGDDMQRVLAGLKPYFDYQVVDTASRITPVTLATLDEADTILLVVTPELAALRNAARFLQLTGQLGYPAEKVLLVLNRADAGRDITRAVVEDQFQRPVASALPSDGRALVQSLNDGVLLVTSHPRHKVARGIDRLTRDIATSFGWRPGALSAREGESTNGANRSAPKNAARPPWRPPWQSRTAPPSTALQPRS